MELSGKVAIVTGAGGGGSGRAIARRLARDGAFVVLSDIEERGGRETLRIIEAARGRAAFFPADVAIETEVRALISFADVTYGGVDIMVNNAGPYWPELPWRSEEHTSELQSRLHLVCRLLLEKKKKKTITRSKYHI